MEFMFARRTPEGILRLTTNHPWNARVSPINGRGPTASNLSYENLVKHAHSSVHAMPDTTRTLNTRCHSVPNIWSALVLRRSFGAPRYLRLPHRSPLLLCTPLRKSVEDNLDYLLIPASHEALPSLGFPTLHSSLALRSIYFTIK